MFVLPTDSFLSSKITGRGEATSAVRKQHLPNGARILLNEDGNQRRGEGSSAPPVIVTRTLKLLTFEKCRGSASLADKWNRTLTFRISDKSEGSASLAM
jgi:hypothetical protein